MKLLLTSGGLTNNLLKKEFLELVNKPASKISIAFIFTASKVEKDTAFVDRDIHNIQSIGINTIHKIDISEPKEKWDKILKSSDVIWIEGGNTFYLLSELRKSGLDKNLKGYLVGKVFVGVSAGSIVVSPDISVAGVEPADKNNVGIKDLVGLGWVDFELSPHTIDYVPLENVEKYAAGMSRKLFAFDDNSAVLVNGAETRVISEGFYKVFN